MKNILLFVLSCVLFSGQAFADTEFNSVAGRTSLIGLWTSCDAGEALGCSGSGLAVGEVSISGTPANYYWAIWTAADTIKGVSVTGSSVVCTDSNGEPEACTSITAAVDLPVSSSTTAGRLGRTSGDQITMGNNAGDATLLFSQTDDSAGNGDTTKAWSADKVYDQLALKLTITDIDDTPVDSETAAPISSNWAYDLENNTVIYSAGATYTPTAQICKGGTIYVNTSGATVNGCPAITSAEFTIVTVGALQVILDPNQTGTEDTVVLDGTALAQGANVTNTSTTGDVLYCKYYTTDTLYCASGSPDGDHWTGP